MSDLFEYYGEAPTTEGIKALSFITDAEMTSEGVEEILDVREIRTHRDTYHRYLVCWQGHPMINSS